LKFDKILVEGDASGNGMVVRFRLPSGLEIFSLPTKNFYSGEWDLGPTWNYAVMADTPFLMDAGRFGQGEHLLGMMCDADIAPSDFDFVLISHSHEDHDGGLAELVGKTNLKVKAHGIYDLLIRHYSDLAPEGYKRFFPAKCWHCFMPASFYEKHCLAYHRVLQHLKVETVGNGENPLGTDIVAHHLPGHSPDCLAVMLGNEAIIVGDILLPQITPWPTRLAMYDEIAPVVKKRYPEPAAILGLRRYIASLKKLRQIGSSYPDIQVFPAHRLFYRGMWNAVDLVMRVDELLDHHQKRCAAILEIVLQGHGTVEAIVQHHFDESLLKGPGRYMAANEVVSHCELMLDCGDMILDGESGYRATGSHLYETVIAE